LSPESSSFNCAINFNGLFFFVMQGGDLIMWDKAKVGHYVGVDIAEGSVSSIPHQSFMLCVCVQVICADVRFASQDLLLLASESLNFLCFLVFFHHLHMIGLDNGLTDCTLSVANCANTFLMYSHQFEALPYNGLTFSDKRLHGSLQWRHGSTTKEEVQLSCATYLY
jgi:hypothetical protein